MFPASLQFSLAIDRILANRIWVGAMPAPFRPWKPHWDLCAGLSISFVYTVETVCWDSCGETTQWNLGSWIRAQEKASWWGKLALITYMSKTKTKLLFCLTFEILRFNYFIILSDFGRIKRIGGWVGWWFSHPEEFSMGSADPASLRSSCLLPCAVSITVLQVLLGVYP